MIQPCAGRMKRLDFAGSNLGGKQIHGTSAIALPTSVPQTFSGGSAWLEISHRPEQQRFVRIDTVKSCTERKRDNLARLSRVDMRRPHDRSFARTCGVVDMSRLPPHLDTAAAAHPVALTWHDHVQLPRSQVDRFQAARG